MLRNACSGPGYAQAGRIEAGLGALDEALAWIEATGVRGFEAEVHRFKGELPHLGRSSQEEAPGSITEAAAEACCRRAIAVARRQGLDGGSCVPR